MNKETIVTSAFIVQSSVVPSLWPRWPACVNIQSNEHPHKSCANA